MHKRENIEMMLNKNKTHSHILPLKAWYGVPIVGIQEENDHAITALYCNKEW